MALPAVACQCHQWGKRCHHHDSRAGRGATARAVPAYRACHRGAAIRHVSGGQRGRFLAKERRLFRRFVSKGLFYLRIVLKIGF